HSLAEASAALDAQGVCWGRYQSMLELVANDPRCSTQNPLFADVEHPETGQYLTPGPPLRFSDDNVDDPGPAPRLGQHTDEVLADVLGMSAAEIASLHDNQIVA
ncbi:MAG: 2-methylfumaryl-CoA isomerase, partial [Acidimicrobiia bacterium]|nr:2-methylfumaryl-CoA isomerase [Acidimicrobiia bacterium]